MKLTVSDNVETNEGEKMSLVETPRPILDLQFTTHTNTESSQPVTTTGFSPFVRGHLHVKLLNQECWMGRAEQ